MGDLVRRLRAHMPVGGLILAPYWTQKAADRIEELEARETRLRRSLDNITLRAYELGQKEIHGMALVALQEGNSDG